MDDDDDDDDSHYPVSIANIKSLIKVNCFMFKFYFLHGKLNANEINKQQWIADRQCVGVFQWSWKIILTLNVQNLHFRM